MESKKPKIENFEETQIEEDALFEESQVGDSWLYSLCEDEETQIDKQKDRKG